MTTIKRSTKKSAKLTDEEKIALAEFVSSHETKALAAKAIKIPLSSLDRIQLAGSGAPKNIKKVRKVISQPLVAA